ncbi:hypothetical protein TNCV_4788951 [Trichonephila clavipes]|nr:hypothetical protein TNCV_4788951 [Trichonephila clavipes]
MFMVLETWVRRGGRDFVSEGPMGVQETSAMEVIFDWRLEENYKKIGEGIFGSFRDELRTAFYLESYFS